MVVPGTAPVSERDESVRDPAFLYASGCRSTGAACSLPEEGASRAALQLGFLRMTGSTLAAMDYVPRAVLKRLGTQLQGLAPEIAMLRALYRVERTLYAHQSWACAYAGNRWPDRVDADAVIQILEDGTAVTLDSQRLAQQVRSGKAFATAGCHNCSWSDARGR